MAVTASGLYGLTLQKMMNATALPTSGLDSETAIKVLLVTDSEAPNFDTHDFRNDITAEVPATGNYTTGGNVITSTALTLSAGVLTYDAADTSWSTSTIANAMAAVGYFGRGGASSADELVFLSDFVTAASSSSGTFTVQWNAAGIFTVDYTP